MINHQIFSTIKYIIDSAAFSARRLSFVFEGEKLHSSEVHLILYISENNNQSKNATRIAEDLGITKGAVSQTVSRLERKGIIIKEKDAYNKNELKLFFTDKGKKILKNCLATQARFQQTIDMLLNDYSNEQKEVILKFLQQLGKTGAKSTFT